MMFFKTLRKIKFTLSRIERSIKWKIKFTFLYLRTIYYKECYYGPFTGEFGHLLGHNLPFISYLYSRGIKVYFCGMEIHRDFFFDELGNSIVNNYESLRDFFSESAPDCNQANEPSDVKNVSNDFVIKAQNSHLPYWDNFDKDYYFNFFRWEILKKKYLKIFNLSQVYKTSEENAVVIFPRKWNNNFPHPNQIQQQLKNNGEIWDYRLVAQTAKLFFDKVYIIGHPVFSNVDFDSFDNVEVIFTNDNKVILEKCSNSKLIISQHSGSVYLGEYTDTPVLIIYKGGRTIGDIDITISFKNGLGRKHDFNYAYNIEEIKLFLKKMQNEKIRN